MKHSIRPTISFQSATIDDKEFTVDVNKSGLFNNKATMDNYAFSLKADYSPIKALRIIAAVRADKFTAPDDTYIGYQGIANYKINEKNIARLLVGRSFAGSFITSAYVNLTVDSNPMMHIRVMGDENLDLLQNDIIELGYKTSIGKKVSFDVSIFRQTYTNFYSQISKVVRAPSFDPMAPGEVHATSKNIALEAQQHGATLAATLLFGNVTFNPFVTWQRTDLSNYSPYYNEPNPVLYPENNTDNVVDKESEFAPNIFGGFSLNLPVKKWNFNVSGYYYDTYRLTGINSGDLATGEITPRTIEKIQSKFLLNAKAGYNFSSKVQAFVNARNILGQEARESYGTDKIGTLLFAGLNINLD